MITRKKNVVSQEEWINRFKHYESTFKKWLDVSKVYYKRYSDDLSSQSSTNSRPNSSNIFWSNTQILGPAIFSKIPKISVRRRFLDKNPVALVASDLIERATSAQLDDYDFSDIVKSLRDEMLIIGRGTAWVRYDPTISRVDVPPVRLRESLKTDELGNERTVIETEDGSEFLGELGDIVKDDRGLSLLPEAEEQLEYENVFCDFVHYDDFFHGPGRDWSEVRWVARRIFLTKQEIRDRFGESVEKLVDLDSVKRELGDAVDHIDLRSIRIPIFECWDRTTKKIHWVSKHAKDVLSVQDDFLGLKDFFPTPKPLFASLAPSSLVPIPLFKMYENFANQLDVIGARIALLTKSLKIAGVYDASIKGIARLFSSGSENTLIPVENYTALSGQGGLANVISYVPLREISQVLSELQVQRKQIQQNIFEVMGISDILRGVSDPRETATAQGLKQQNASIRIKDMQSAIEKYLRDLLRIKAEIISEHFAEQTLLLTSGMKIETQEDQQLFTDAIELLRDQAKRHFLIEVETDSTISVDSELEKRQRIEFVEASSGFLQQMISVSTVAPQLVPVLSETLLFALRAFPAGRELEQSYEQALQSLEQAGEQEQGQDVELQQQQDNAQTNEGNQIEFLKLQQQSQLDKARLELEREKAAARLQLETAKAEGKLSLEQEKTLRQLQLLEAKLLGELRIKTEAQTVQSANSIRAQNESRFGL